MRILLIHNSHRSGSSSGDDVIFNREVKLLEKCCHQIIKINPSNDEYDSSNVFKKLSIVLQIPWSFNYYRKIKKIVKKEALDIIHVHNFFPLFSPAIFYSVNLLGVPIIQTLHDFRHLCAMAFLTRHGNMCEECKHGKFYRSIRYGCFKKSKLQTIPVALMLKLHDYLKTFQNKIDGYVCLTKSQKNIFIKVGYDKNKLFEKPNFVEDTCLKKEYKKGDYVVFIGRLGEEKGLKILIKALYKLSEIPLKIIGAGPDSDEYKKYVRKLGLKNIEFLGYKPFIECMEILDDARFLVMPSICNETFGLAIVEAFCHFKPVIVSNLGAMADIVEHKKTGLLFTPWDSDELSKKIKWLWDHPDECRRMGENARKEYKEKYTPEKNYKMLMDIYQKTIEMHNSKRRK